MDAIWGELDPLNQKKGVPAAPVTSLEQAEVLLSKTDKPNDGKSENNDNTPNESTPTENEPAKSSFEDDKNLSPKSKNPVETLSVELNTPQDTSRRSSFIVKQDDQAEGATLLDLSNEPQESSKLKSNETPKNLVSSTIKDNKESSSADNINKESSSEDATNKNDHSQNISEDGERHPGDLRKHSIAAMKELGTPITPVISDNTMAEDDSVASFDFQKFMDSLRTKSADPIARYIKSFLQEFTRAVWTPKQQEKIISDFHKFISIKLRDYEPFASMNKRERLNTLEGVEKLIMNRLYTRTFSPKIPPILRSDGHTEDLLKDEVFEEKMRLWGWVEGRHLDINDEYLKSSFIHLATTELSRLNQFKSPRDKMICILNCSKVIYALIRQARLEQNADSFLPLLIYVVLKAHPVHLVSTVNYIQRFRSKEFQRGETAYYLSTLASAVTFIETLDHSSLTITAEEFEQRMADSARAENIRKHQQQSERELMNDNDSGINEGESSAAVLTASAGMLVDRMRKFTTKLFEELATPEEEVGRSNATSSQHPVGQRSSSATRTSYREQEQATQEASREEYIAEQARREHFSETLSMLENMFPSLDKDVIEDVLRQNGANVGSAVDICLALVG